MSQTIQVDTEKLFELLPRTEVKALTGRTYRDDQIAWLRFNDIPHKIDAKGWPQVYRCHAIGVTVEAV